MKLLILASNYPYRGSPFSGIFNERNVEVLRSLCDGLSVLVPHPYVPLGLSSFVSRWKAYAGAVRYEISNGVSVYRPRYLQIPRVGRSFWHDQSAFLCCCRVVRKMHSRIGFNAVLGLDLVGTGVMAWRIGRHLGIPTAGWVFGHAPPFSAHRKTIARALKNFEVVFYQSHAVLEEAAELLGISPDQMSSDRHLVLPHGIPVPSSLPRKEIRNRIRTEWGVTDDKILILSIGRITREKGIFELVNSVALATAQDPRITCVIIGSHPAFDETASVQRIVHQAPWLKGHVRLLPACSPEKVGEYLCAADIFAFTSHQEGMPNSLLEALAIGVPAAAFAIPPVLEIEAGTGALILVPPFDTSLFAQTLIRLAVSPDDRTRIGEKGKKRVMDGFQVQKNMARAFQQLTQMVQQHS